MMRAPAVSPGPGAVPGDALLPDGADPPPLAPPAAPEGALPPAPFVVPAPLEVPVVPPGPAVPAGAAADSADVPVCDLNVKSTTSPAIVPAMARTTRRIGSSVRVAESRPDHRSGAARSPPGETGWLKPSADRSAKSPVVAGGPAVASAPVLG